MQGDIKSHNLPAIVGQDDHYIQQPKRCGSHDKHVDGSDTLGLIEQEAMPGRGWTITTEPERIDRGAVTTSVIPIAATRLLKTEPYEAQVGGLHHRYQRLAA